MWELEREMEHGSEVHLQLGHLKDQTDLQCWVEHRFNNTSFPIYGFPSRMFDDHGARGGFPAEGLTNIYGFSHKIRASGKSNTIKNSCPNEGGGIIRLLATNRVRHNQMRAVPQICLCLWFCFSESNGSQAWGWGVRQLLVWLQRRP